MPIAPIVSTVSDDDPALLGDTHSLTSSPSPVDDSDDDSTYIREHNMQGALCLWAEHILPVDSRTSCIWTQRVVHTVWTLSIMCCLYAGRVPARLHSMICG